MKKAILTRFHSDEFKTLGKLQIEELNLYTLELPYRNNQRRISCIPTGEYIAKPYFSPKHKKCFLITGVPKRDLILIHKGNYNIDTLGCILVGLGISTNQYSSKDAFIVNSKQALNKMIIKLKKEFILKIC